MFEDFKDLNAFVAQFVNVVEHPEDDADYPRRVCEMSRLLLTRCAMADFSEETGWDAATADKAEKALQKAINVRPGSIFQNNIAERAQTFAVLKQKSQALRVSDTNEQKAPTKPSSQRRGRRG